MFRNELGSITRLTLLVGSLGVGVGLVALWYWTNLIGYAFVIPVLWIVAALMVTLGIGLVIGSGSTLEFLQAAYDRAER